MVEGVFKLLLSPTPISILYPATTSGLVIEYTARFQSTGRKTCPIAAHG